MVLLNSDCRYRLALTKKRMAQLQLKFSCSKLFRGKKQGYEESVPRLFHADYVDMKQQIKSINWDRTAKKYPGVRIVFVFLCG